MLLPIFALLLLVVNYQRLRVQGMKASIQVLQRLSLGCEFMLLSAQTFQEKPNTWQRCSVKLLIRANNAIIINRKPKTNKL